MNEDVLKSAIEAMLMVSDEPVSLSRLVTLIEKQLGEQVAREKII